MQVRSLLQLAAGGNFKSVEEQWMANVENESATPDTVIAMVPVAEELAKRGQGAEASTLAWTTVELLKERFEPREVLPVAGALLLKLKGSQELRDQACALYSAAYEGTPGLESLLEEAGIAGGRPPRRALRTLDTCLAVAPDRYVAGRHEDATARVTAVETDPWSIQVTKSSGQTEEFGPVEFADTYELIDSDDFRALRDFDPEALSDRLQSDPAGIVISILCSRGGKLDSDQLKGIVCPAAMPAGDWGKWWTKARNALKRSPHVQIEGRSPYVLTYLEEARSLEEETLREFGRKHDPADLYAAVEDYIRECGVQKKEVDSECLRSMRERLETTARRQKKSGNDLLFATRLTQRRIDKELGSDGSADAVRLLQDSDDPVRLILVLDSVALWEAGCGCLVEAHPDRAMEILPELLLIAPMAVCDFIAGRLVSLGYTQAAFDELSERIQAEPRKCFQALCWLWDGPSEGKFSTRPLLPLLTRLLGVLTDLRRSDEVDRHTQREIVTTARAALSARRHERFKACLEEIDASMGSALLTTIRRLDNLGRAVHEDLQKLIRKRFPELVRRKLVAPWADPAILFTTSQGLQKKQAEVEELVNVKMKENAKRIGEAASLGDLSENSEYKFALEERDLLRARLAQMQNQLSIAEVLKPDTISTDFVGPGTRVLFRRKNADDSVEMTFLGPWEGDLQRHVYNYKAPFSQSLMGRTVGDVVHLDFVEPAGDYRIDSISNALAAPA